MAFTKNCEICMQQVGKLGNGNWVFYVETGVNHTIINHQICASVKYGCQNCVNQNNWTCVSCDTVYDKEDEFCNTKGYNCCKDCIEKEIIRTNNFPRCHCLVCQGIVNNSYLNNRI
jgi:hypothetical protein